jgi:regulator of replication initiation timing
MGDRAVCPQCSAVQRDVSDLRNKESRLRKRVRALENSVSDLTLRNRILEEENQLLRASKCEPAPAAPALDAAPITHFFDDFDSLFAAQGKDISHLLSDRNRLVSLSFSALSLAATQESALHNLRSAVGKLLNFISQKGETAGNVVSDFASLGVDCGREVEIINNHFYIRDACSSASCRVGDAAVLDILRDLPSLRVERESLQKLSDFVRSQVAEKATLRLEIEKLQDTSDAFRQELVKLKSVFGIRDSQVPISAQISRKFEKLRRLAAARRGSQKLLDQLVSLLIQFAAKNSNDVNQRCPLHRLRRWTGNPDVVDLLREVEFLLGLWQTDNDDEEHRRQFIQDRLAGGLPESATWTEVCEFLTDRARPRNAS